MFTVTTKQLAEEMEKSNKVNAEQSLENIDSGGISDSFEEEVDYTEPCYGRRCTTCQQIVPGNTRETHTCQSKNVVYKISRGGMNYIGKTTAPMSKRMSQHKHAIKAGRGDGQKFTDFFRNQANFDEAEITILDSADNDRDLREKERYWINHYDSYNNGLNSTR